jgi:hypothetical protein
MLRTPNFERIAELTEAEREAARAYTSDSVRLHHVMQGRDGMGCALLDRGLVALQAQVPLIDSATRKFRLAEEALLYAGIGNGYPAVGSLWDNDPARFVGMSYHYSGFFSTSTDPGVAHHFMEVGNTFRQVFLTIRAKPGLLGLPTYLLGADSGHEGEVLVAARTSFTIVDARRRPGEKADVLHFDLTT